MSFFPEFPNYKSRFGSIHLRNIGTLCATVSFTALVAGAVLSVIPTPATQIAAYSCFAVATAFMAVSLLFLVASIGLSLAGYCYNVKKDKESLDAETVFDALCGN